MAAERPAEVEVERQVERMAAQAGASADTFEAAQAAAPLVALAAVILERVAGFARLDSYTYYTKPTLLRQVFFPNE